MNRECPACGHIIDIDELEWAYERFGREVCSECGWHGMKMRHPPFRPRELDIPKRFVRRIA